MTTSSVEKLYIAFHGRVLEHLGIQMYQSPVNALAEFVANAWDAEAKKVEIFLPENIDGNSVVSVADDGLGMTREECQKRFLYVGYNRRGVNPAEHSPTLHRPILGRKGIGKFAGFGIAEVIRIDTISSKTGERTVFELDIKDLTGKDYIGMDKKEVIEIIPPPERPNTPGTIVTLSKLKLKQAMRSDFPKSMARRFLMLERQTGFKVFVNGSELPKSISLEDIQYSFPRDYPEDKKYGEIVEVDPSTGWASEFLPNGKKIRWRFLFHKDTIDEEELRGITIYSKDKLVQAPFFFHLVGGLGGQHGTEYLTGQVEADYLDLLPEDITTTERQRINWENEEASVLLKWGQERLKRLLRLWHDLRGEKRLLEIEDKLSGFSERLEKLPTHERKTIKSAISKLALISTLDEEQFDELVSSMMTAWEQGRLRELIDAISSQEGLNADGLLSLLIEADVLVALNIAEAVKTKLGGIRGLEKLVQKGELENKVRDYVAERPYLLNPKWETFKKETAVKHILDESAREARLEQDDIDAAGRKRIDLALRSNEHLLVVEFMRPGKILDYDHLSRCKRYIHFIREKMETNTAFGIEKVTGLIVADGLDDKPDVRRELKDMKNIDIHAYDWKSLIAEAEKTFGDFLTVIGDRAPGDLRIKRLKESTE
jgi:hypothetical protein